MLRTVVAALALFPAAASAQTVVVRVLNAEAGQPLFGALAYLVDAEGRTERNALTDERGRALFIGIEPGGYSIRVEMIGMATGRTEAFAIASGTTISQELRLASRAIQLEGLEVEMEGGRCQVRPQEEGLLVARVWDEARKALSAAAFTDNVGSYRYETMTYERRIDRETGIMLSEEQNRREGYMATPFESRPAEDLVANGFVQDDGPGQLYFAPDASVLLSDAFLDTHCFRLEDADDDEELIGLGFEPTGENRRIPDISGKMWLDPETGELQWLEYRYRNLDPDLSSPEVGGRVDFRRMPNGTWIVPEWWIKMPVVGVQTDAEGLQRQFIAQYHQTGGVVVEARESGGRRLGRAETGGIDGLVTDSIGLPLPGVRIGVVGSNQEVYSNADGEFGIRGLQEGRYQIRFIDPGLEAFGYIPEPVTRDVIRGEAGFLQHHMPSVGDVLFEACRGQAVPDESVVVAGRVVDARGRPVPGAVVTARWEEYDERSIAYPLDVSDVRMRSEGFESTASATGFYRFCGLPAEALITLTARTAELESGRYELRISRTEGARLAVIEVAPTGGVTQPQPRTQ